MEPAFHGCSSLLPDTMVLMWFGCSGHCGHADATYVIYTWFVYVDLWFSFFGSIRPKSVVNVGTAIRRVSL